MSAVVDRDALAEALSQQNWSNASTRMDPQRFWRERADAILASGVVQDSREFAKNLLLRIGEEPQPRDNFQHGAWAENRRVRHIIRKHVGGLEEREEQDGSR